MRKVTIRIIAAALAMVALAGCDTAEAPGSATVSVHGRVETSIGGYSR